MWGLVVPVIGVLLEFFRLKKADGLKDGVPVVVAQTAVGKVGAAVDSYLSRDERFVQAELDAVERARRHDVDMGVKMPVVDLLRGLVRPLITLTAFFWYVYARVHGVVMLPEDYAIIGGILAFWFGFRPFEKIGVPGGGGRKV